MFQMVFYKDNICEYNIPEEIYYNDAELDEYKEKILENRKKNNIQNIIYINIFFKKIIYINTFII